MEDNLKKKKKNGRRPQKKMEDDLKKNGRRPQKEKEKMEDDLKKKKKKRKTTWEKNGRRPKNKWKTNQSNKINLIGCDTIVNSPSRRLKCQYKSLECLHDS